MDSAKNFVGKLTIVLLVVIFLIPAVALARIRCGNDIISEGDSSGMVMMKLEKCGELLDSLKMKLTIPGLLFIDTPGHAVFTNLRKRGGNLADIAILVVDINEGFKPQTMEALEIL